MSDEDLIKKFLVEREATQVPPARADGLPDPEKQRRKDLLDGRKYNYALRESRAFVKMNRKL